MCAILAVLLMVGGEHVLALLALTVFVLVCAAHYF